MIEAYPLQWPAGRPRKPETSRAFGRFSKVGHNGWKDNLTVNDALGRLRGELSRMGVDDYVISSNLQTRLDGLPKSGQAEPSDPGVALYFRMKGKPHCLPCDTYTKVAQNIAAIAAHIEKTRAIERYGVASIAEMFTGFAALPAPVGSDPWWQVLGVSQTASKDEISAAYREKAKKLHKEGKGEGHFVKLNIAKDEGLAARA